jgi:ribosomal protein S18 acetylase RimI-like enzyme
MNEQDLAASEWPLVEMNDEPDAVDERQSDGAEAAGVPISIRPLSATDLKANAMVLADVLIEIVRGGAPMGFLVPLDRDQARDYWLSLRREVHIGRRVVLAAFDGDRIVGSGQLEFPRWPNARHRAELQKLFVSKERRTRGVGRMLMAALHGAARDRGRSLILLGTRRGGQAEGFYRTLGYRVVGVIPGYSVGTSGERYDLVSLYRELL